VMAWVERGGIYVYAHVRGGGALGSQWHEAGHKTTKFNTWKDGIAAAEWLIANGYTSAAKLGIYGGSAGGIFVGRAITERPDLFAVAVPSVPVLDMVRSEQRANGVANIPENGTVKVEPEFHALLRNSSYHAVKEGVRNLLAHAGVLKDWKIRNDGPTRLVELKGKDYYVYAPEPGLFEPFCELGEMVKAGQPCGQVHFFDNPAREPILCHFKRDGLLVCKRHQGRVERGDCVAHLATDRAA